MPKGKILLVEDDQIIAKMLKGWLEDAGYEVTATDNGVDAVHQAQTVNLVVLDLNLPGLNGTAVCERIRKLHSQVPIIMLSATRDHDTQSYALNAGADVFLVKPDDVYSNKFIAQVKAFLRRSRGFTSSVELIVRGPLIINITAHTIAVNCRESSLPRREWELLLELAQHPKMVMSPSTLLERVWGYDYEGEERVVGKTLYNLRRKLSVICPNIKFIRTDPGHGYCWDVE